MNLNPVLVVRFKSLLAESVFSPVGRRCGGAGWFQLVLATAGLLWLGLSVSQGAPGTASGLATSFRVMSYNIHHGEGLDGKVNLERIAALIKSEKADIVALQEVDKNTKRTGQRDFPAELATLTGMTCVFSNNLSLQGGQYGNAILTRFPVQRSTNTHLAMLKSGEQRGILQVVLTVQGRELVFMATHIDHRGDDAERLHSADQILALVKLYGSAPVILCGDFNDVPASRTYEKFAGAFVDSWAAVGQGDGFTIPAEKPRKRIDYLWVLKDRAVVSLNLHVPESKASDHRPVVGEFRWDSK